MQLAFISSDNPLKLQLNINLLHDLCLQRSHLTGIFYLEIQLSFHFYFLKSVDSECPRDELWGDEISCDEMSVNVGYLLMCQQL